MNEHSKNAAKQFEQMSSELLLELLRQDLDSDEEIRLSITSLRSILSVLSCREEAESSVKLPDREEAKRSFLQDYLPLSCSIFECSEMETAVKSPSLPLDVPLQRKQKKNGHSSRPSMQQLKRFLVSAVMITLCTSLDS